MDTFENNEQLQEEATPAPGPGPSPEDSLDQVSDREEPVSQEKPKSTTYSGVGTGRKESPYADSPYVVQRQPEFSYQPQTHKPPKKEKPRKKAASGRGRRAVAVILTVALVAAGCLITAVSVNSSWEKRTEETVSALNARIDALEDQTKTAAPSGGTGVSRPAVGSGLTPSQLYETSVDSVVAISSSIGVPGYFGISEGTSSGSGFILREDGYVVTNAHVVENATAVTVILNDGTEYDAQVVGSDTSNDISVLKIEGEDLPAVTVGSSGDLQIGDMVVAIGNPLGTLASTQTVGYVSGINREVTTDNTIISMLQTDAAINPGNSGGPLFNMQGQVIGITTAKYSGTTGSGASIEGIGFAIPIDDVKEMLSDLVDFGYVTGAYLGITVRDMDPDAASMYGLPNGAYVDSVEEGGAADRAGVQPKDIITKLGEQEVTSRTELTRSLRSFKAGDETTITVVRGGRELTLTIILDEKPKGLNNPAYKEEPEMPDSGDYDEWFEYFRRYFEE